jgi:hypothetical protein
MWEQFAKRQQRIEKAYVPRVKAAISKEIGKVVAHIKRNGLTGYQSFIHHAINAEDVFKILKDLYKTAAIQEANITYKELRAKHYKLRTFGYNEAWSNVIDTHLGNLKLLETCQNISETTKERILQVIAKGLREGLGFEEIARQIESDEIPLQRARLIVRTESIGAMNIGSMMGAISTGIQYQKRWVTAKDHRVRGTKPTDRFSHLALSGDTVEMVKSFNNGEAIRYPGDKNASPGNFCNCRCTMQYIAKRDSSGSIMLYPNVPKKPAPGKEMSNLLISLIGGVLFGDSISDLF